MHTIDSLCLASCVCGRKPTCAFLFSKETWTGSVVFSERLPRAVKLEAVLSTLKYVTHKELCVPYCIVSQDSQPIIYITTYWHKTANVCSVYHESKESTCEWYACYHTTHCEIAAQCCVHPSPAMQHITNRTEACEPGVFGVQAEQTEETHGDRKLSVFPKSHSDVIVWWWWTLKDVVMAVCVCVSINQTVGLYRLHVLWAWFGD